MRRYFIIAVALFFTACQNDDFEVPGYSQKIVVDGWIEPGQPARVFLTFSTSYFSAVDSASIRKLLLTCAKVTVTDGESSEVLTLRGNRDYFPPYVYESLSLRGAVGHTYNLKVEYGGVTVTSTTQIPETPHLDSIWFDLASGIDTAGYVKVRFTDAPNMDNYYRIMTKTGKSTTKYVPVFLPNLDGRLVDGQEITMSITREEDGRRVLFSVNDTVTLKLCTVELPVYKFWESLYNELLNTENPFAANSSNIISNVNGGLGVWAGYGVSIKSVICK